MGIFLWIVFEDSKPDGEMFLWVFFCLHVYCNLWANSWATLKACIAKSIVRNCELYVDRNKCTIAVNNTSFLQESYFNTNNNYFTLT